MNEDEFTVWAVEGWRLIIKKTDRKWAVSPRMTRGGITNCFSRDGKLMAVLEDGSVPKILNTSTWDFVAEYDGDATSIAFSPDNSQIAIGKGGWQGTMPAYHDYGVSLWNINNNDHYTFAPEATWVHDAILSPDGKYIGIIDESSLRLRLLNIDTGHVVLTTSTPEIDRKEDRLRDSYPMAAGPYITNWRFSPDSQHIICDRLSDPYVFILDVNKRTWLPPFPTPMMSVIDVNISNNGEVVAIAGIKAAIKDDDSLTYDAGSCCYVYRSVNADLVLKIENNAVGRPIHHLNMSNDSRFLGYIERIDKANAILKIWNLNNKQLSTAQSLEYINEAVQFSQNGLFVSYGKRIWKFNGTDLKKAKLSEMSKPNDTDYADKIEFYFSDTRYRNTKSVKSTIEEGIGLKTNNLVIRERKNSENATDHLARLICFEKGIIILTP
jgi:WD40 repeat protein